MKADQFSSFRGPLMILVMKIVSVAFDNDTSRRQSTDLLSMLSYCFHPATILFGPWFAYDQQRSTLSMIPYRVSMVIDTVM